MTVVPPLNVKMPEELLSPVSVNVFSPPRVKLTSPLMLPAKVRTVSLLTTRFAVAAEVMMPPFTPGSVSSPLICWVCPLRSKVPASTMKN